MQQKERRRVFGRRQGRPLRASQKALLQAHLARLCVTLPADGRLLPRTLFPVPCDDVWLEIGFGGGEHLAGQALAHPTVGLIGAEVFMNGVAMAVSALVAQSAANVRVYTEDARNLLEALPDASLGKIFLLFPDPWPKKRHQERRFVSSTNLDAFARLLRPGGELRIATDDPGYLLWTLRHMGPRADFHWTAQSASDWRQRPADWPQTRYEKKALAAGRPPTFLIYRRA